MMTRALLSILSMTCLSAVAAPIYSETFDTPTGATYTYPIAQGYRSHLNDRVNGWAGNATIEITYANGLGQSGGGIRCQVVKAGTDYAVMNLRLPLASVAAPGALTVDDLRSMVVSFSIQGSQGLMLNPAIHPSAKVEWNVRLTFPEILLFSDWSEVRLVLANAKSEALTKVVEAYNTGDKSELVLALYLKDLVDWQPGDGFRFDNLAVNHSKR